jgi:4-hydroxy-2-oxoheptanedioate aldolase
MRDSTLPPMTVSTRPVQAVAVMFAFVTLGLWPATGAQAQAQTRLNKIIETIEAGQPAIAGEVWRWIGMEHAPFSVERLATMLDEMDNDRDADGRLQLTPIVRIPQDGDEDFKWAIKQVLDMGIFGVVVPHVDTKAEAMRFVQAMRYPQTKDSAYQEPEGLRGWGPGRAARLWTEGNSSEYHAKADVWPLNPDGELFAVAIIESVEAIENIDAILEAPLSAILMVPGDTSLSMGLGPFGTVETHPEVDDMYARVLEACQAQDKVICGCASASNLQQRRLDEGWQFFLPLGPAPD